MRLARLLLAGSILAVGLTGVRAVLPGPAFACSCVGPEPMATHRGDPLKPIFVATIAAAGPAGVDVAVERWFQGSGEQFVRLAPDGFGDQSAACQTPVPPVGSRWIYVAFIPEVGAAPQVNLCTPQGRLDTKEGAAMLAEVEAAFGGGQPVSPEPTDPAAPQAPVDPAEIAAPAVAIGLVGLVAVVLFGGAALLVRRRGAASGP